MIDKNVDLDCISSSGCKPIDNLLRHQDANTTIEVCKYFNKTKIKMEQLKKLHENENIKTFKEYYKVLRYFRKNGLVE